jgi:hypothetical protein
MRQLAEVSAKQRAAIARLHELQRHLMSLEAFLDEDPELRELLEPRVQRLVQRRSPIDIDLSPPGAGSAPVPRLKEEEEEGGAPDRGSDAEDA